MSPRSKLRLALYFLRQDPWRNTRMLFFIVASGFVEGFGLIALLPLLQSFINPAQVNAQGPGAAVIDLIRRVGLEPSFATYLFIVVAAILVKSSFLLLGSLQVGRTISTVATELRLTLLQEILASRWSYFVSQPIGRLSNAIASEASRAAAAFQSVGNLLASFVQVCVYAYIAARISWQVTALAFVSAPLGYLAFRGLVGRSRRAGEQETAHMKSLMIRLTDVLQGIKPIKAMGRESKILPLLERTTRDLNRALGNAIISGDFMRILQEPIVVLILSLGLWGMVTYGHMEFSKVLLLAFLFQRLLTHFFGLQRYYQSLSVVESAFWSIREAIDSSRALREDLRPSGKRPTAAAQIAFDRVSFGHEARPVLEGLSFTIRAGSFATIVGPSGAGKTTAVDLLAGLLTPQSGRILVDGVPLQEIDLVAWRAQIGYVPQEMLLFHDSIHRNVTLSDDAIGPEAVERALRDAEAWDFVQELPQGTATPIGERGTRLSGGQRQRLALARALVSRPSLLILDEVTTALDPATELAICHTLKRLSGQMTIVSISHQPAMKAVADQVITLEVAAEETARDPLPPKQE